jgi:hypothetical protein
MATVATPVTISKAFFAHVYEESGILAKVDGTLYFFGDDGSMTEFEPEMAPFTTVTEVADFGGGRIPNPDLNFGLRPAPECLQPSTTDVPPGETLKVKGLSPGNHCFQCCIHPWMRTLIKVHPEEEP